MPSSCYAIAIRGARAGRGLGKLTRFLREAASLRARFVAEMCIAASPLIAPYINQPVDEAFVIEYGH